MEVFTIAPADTRAFSGWLVLCRSFVLVLVIGILWASINGARTARFRSVT